MAIADWDYLVSNPQQVMDLNELSDNDYYVLQHFGTNPNNRYPCYDADSKEMSTTSDCDYSCVVQLIYNNGVLNIKQACTDTYYQGLAANAQLQLGDTPVDYTIDCPDDSDSSPSDGVFRFISNNCFLHVNINNQSYPIGAASMYGGGNSRWKIFKVELKNNPMPQNGKVYHINFVSLDQSKTWGISSSGNKLSVAENANGSEFVAYKYQNTEGQVRYIFINNEDGYYLSYSVASETFDLLGKASNEFSVGLLSNVSNTYVTASSEQKEGKVYITSDGRSTTDALAGCYILQESSATFNAAPALATAPFYNGTYTSALTFTKVEAEVSVVAALAIDKFKALYAAKPYKDQIGNIFGTYSAMLNGDTYNTIGDYVDAVNSATSIDSYAITFIGPEDGKMYKISSYQKDGSLYQIVNGGESGIVINITGEIVDDANGYWICHKAGDNYKFSSAAKDGSYFGWQQISTSPYAFNLLEGVNAGYLSLYSVGNTGGGRYLYVHKNANGGTKGWNQNSVSAFTDTGSTDFLFEEVSLTLDENEDMAAIIAENDGFVFDVTLNRTFNENAWNTLVLPFNMTAEEVTEVFGDDMIVANYVGTEGETLLFSTEDAGITANQPVFIYGASDVTVVKNRTIVAAEQPTWTPEGAAYSFVGSYAASTQLTAGDVFIGSDNKLYSVGETAPSMKGTRAVFRPTSAGVKVTNFVVDGTVTGIVKAEADGIRTETGDIYNLAGQKVLKMQKGIYIINGKKVVNK